jgi:4-hydroxy-tetrahydrodipicolinate reductase
MRLIIVGANGKLGKLVLAQAARDSSIEIVGQVSRSFNNTAPFFNSINNINSACDCILDVSHPDNLSEILAYAQNHHTPLVIATTGFNVSQVEQINTAARQIPILLTSNTSLGVFSFRQLVAKATKLLNN